MPTPTFAELAAGPDPSLDLLALALAAEFRTVDTDASLALLDGLGEDLTRAIAATDGSPAAQALCCSQVLGGQHGFIGDREDYDHPDNSMLDVVLEDHTGLPILLSVVYVEAARRAEVPLAGVGLPGHFVVGHFGAERPLLIDPFNGGVPVEGDIDESYLEPWSPVETAMRMLNNLVGTFQRRGDMASAIHAAGMRLALPADEDLREVFQAELRAMRSQLN